MGRLHREARRLLAIEQHQQVVRLVQPFHVFVAIPREAHLDLVVPRHRKVVGDQGPAPRPERKPLHPLFLGSVARQADHPQLRRARIAAHRQAADLPGRRDITIQQGRGKTAHRDVVEAVTRLVLRQQFGNVHLQAQEIANGVLILGAGQTANRVGAAGIGSLRRRVVQHRHQLFDGLPVGLLPGAFLPRRRHLAGLQPPDHLLPGVRVVLQRGPFDHFQVEPAFFRSAVMAIKTILPQHLPQHR